MAMLDLEDSSDIKVNNSHTSSETLLKGRRLERVEVNDSTAGNGPLRSNEAGKPESGKGAVRRVVEAAIAAALGTAIVAACVWAYKMIF